MDQGNPARPVFPCASDFVLRYQRRFAPQPRAANMDQGNPARPVFPCASDFVLRYPSARGLGDWVRVRRDSGPARADRPPTRSG